MWIIWMGYHMFTGKVPQAVNLFGKWFPGEIGEALSKDSLSLRKEILDTDENKGVWNHEQSA